MKKHEKIATGIAIGAVVALFLIPKTRKMLSGTLSNITDSLKSVLHKAGDMAATVN